MKILPEIKVDWNGAAKPIFVILGTTLVLCWWVVIWAVTK